MNMNTHPYHHPSTARKCARIGPPLFLLIWFLITGTVVLVYNIGEGKPVPRKTVQVLGIFFAVLAGLWFCCWGCLGITKKGGPRSEGNDVERNGDTVLAVVRETPPEERPKPFSNEDEEEADQTPESSPPPSLPSAYTPPPNWPTTKQQETDLFLGHIFYHKETPRVIEHMKTDARKGDDKLPVFPSPFSKEQQVRYMTTDISGITRYVQVSRMTQRRKARVRRANRKDHHVGGLFPRTFPRSVVASRLEPTSMLKTEQMGEFRDKEKRNDILKSPSSQKAAVNEDISSLQSPDGRKCRNEEPTPSESLLSESELRRRNFMEMMESERRG